MVSHHDNDDDNDIIPANVIIMGTGIRNMVDELWVKAAAILNGYFSEAFSVIQVFCSSNKKMKGEVRTEYQKKT